MHPGRAFAAGVAGALIITGLMVGLSGLALPKEIDVRLASLLGAHLWFVGLALYLLIGGLLGLAYALVFEKVVHQSGVGPGLMLGAYNTILAGFVWAALGGPGPFWESAGPKGIMMLFLTHFAFGALVGGLYRSDQVAI